MQSTSCKILGWRKQPSIFPMKWGDRMPWSLFSECWALSQLFHSPLSLSCIGEGNGNPLQCSCLENPRDEGAWGAAVYGIAQSRTRLKRLSSSSGSCFSDCVDHNKLWKILQEVGVPDHLTCLLRNLCASQKQQLELDWNNELVSNWERSKLRLHTITLLI